MAKVQFDTDLGIWIKHKLIWQLLLVYEEAIAGRLPVEKLNFDFFEFINKWIYIFFCQFFA
jgi:hypothetical protein